MHQFDYARPAGLDEALELLGRPGGDAKILAGGQSLVPLLNYRLARPRLVVDIGRLPLAGIAVAGGRVRIGALTRYHALEESADLARHAALVAEAARLVGNVRVRSLGTLGGSLAHADPAGEMPLAMLALDAEVTARSVRGSRRLRARDLFTGYLTTALEEGELLTEIEMDDTRGQGAAVEELARRAGDFALVAVAAVLGVDRRGRVDDARLAYGGVGPVPRRSPRAEDALRGHEPGADRLAAAARAARAEIIPGGDAFASAAYRSLLVEVLTRRALTRATARALEVA